MKKHVQAILVLLLLSLAYGCSPPGEDATEVPLQNTNSTEGLAISFVKGAPPDEIYAYSGSDSYDIVLNIENKGTYSINCSSNKCGTLTIFSGDPINYNETGNLIRNPGDSDAVLRGKNLYLPGERLVHSSEMKVGTVQGEAEVSLFALACYPYKTVFSESVCVDLSDYTSSEEEKACQAKDLTFSGQGAPIAIKRVEQQRLSSRIIFKIFLENMGKGNIIDFDSYEQICTAKGIENEVKAEEASEKSLGRITIEAANFSREKLNCDNENDFITLAKDSENFIYCVYDHEGDQEAFVSQLYLELSYGYQSTYSKKIKIVSFNDPPIISALNIPGEINSSTNALIKGVATDDKCVSEILLIKEDNSNVSNKYGDCDADRKKIREFTFSDKPELSFKYKINNSKSKKFEAIGTFEYVYRVRAVDDQGIASKIKSSIVKVSDNPIIKSLKTTSGGTMIVKAADDRRVARIDLKGWKDLKPEDEQETEDGDQRKVNQSKECGTSSCTRNFQISSLGPGKYCIQAFDGGKKDNSSIPVYIQISGSDLVKIKGNASSYKELQDQSNEGSVDSCQTFLAQGPADWPGSLSNPTRLTATNDPTPPEYSDHLIESDVVIGIEVLDTPDYVIPNDHVAIYTRVGHTGRPRLSFSLEEAPPEMSIDFNHGIITWAPRKADAGKTFEVTVRVTDGGKFGQTRFKTTVVKSEPFSNEIQGNVLTVTDPDTNLNGLSVTLLPEGSRPTTFPVPEKPPQHSIPEVPPLITPLSDVFLVTDVFYRLDDPIEFRFPVPLDRLPGGVSSLDDVYLYVYAKAVHGDKSWLPVGCESFEGTVENPVCVVSLTGMYGFAFFGYHRTSPAIPFDTE